MDMFFNYLVLCLHIYIFLHKFGLFETFFGKSLEFESKLYCYLKNIGHHY